eukprot:1130297-Rhodomonas_salina.13
MPLLRHVRDLGSYAFATRCPILCGVLCDFYAVSGTEIGYAATRFCFSEGKKQSLEVGCSDVWYWYRLCP